MKNLILLLLLLCTVTLTAEDEPEYSQPVVVGAERMAAYLPLLQGKSVGLIVNHTSLVRDQHLVDALLAEGVQIKAIFAPEHGFRGTADAGEKVVSGKDAQTGLPVISLYGSHKKPTPQDLAGIDVIVFDIQDVGVRFYTYISTMSLAMEACAEQGIPFIVLDRPNPNGMLVDGPMMREGHTSFIGMHTGVPVAHGMTVGEYAQMVNGEGWLKDGIKVDLTVVECRFWLHDKPYELPVPPSPNLPNQRSIYLYPTLCLFEGTVMSVGRGTNTQFQVVGHPYFPGEYSFTPVPGPGSKDPLHNGKRCKGIDFTSYEPDSIRMMQQIRLDWLLDVYHSFPDKNHFFNKTFTLLAGGTELQEQMEAGLTEAEIRITWQEGLEQFETRRKPYLLYR